MKHRVLTLCLLFLGCGAVAPFSAHAQIPSPEVQVANAVLAAPTGQQGGATVLGFRSNGQLVTLRAGTNELVCLADTPNDDLFSVACYHESLEPYMARGRALVAQGVTEGTEKNRIRWEEAEDGSLAMPENPATLYVLTGSSYDPVAGKVADSYLRFVVYMPWATVEETGLPNAPMTPGSPWLMYPGTAGAHVMISPPQTSPGG